MKAKPIQPGCLALVIGKVNFGRVVRVQRLVSEQYYVGPSTPIEVTMHGGVQAKGSWLCTPSDLKGPTLHCVVFPKYSSSVFAEWQDVEKPFRENALMRLDDDEINDDVLIKETETS